MKVGETITIKVTAKEKDVAKHRVLLGKHKPVATVVQSSWVGFNCVRVGRHDAARVPRTR